MQKHVSRGRWPARKIGVFAVILALAVAFNLHLVSAVKGSAPCTDAAGNGLGCSGGGSFQVPDFFRGYATQGSTGTAYGAGSTPFVSWGAATSHQPVAYPTRPPWQVAGVDYGVGMPMALAPTLDNLSGQPGLKDPAQIAGDRLANPDGAGADCTFVTANTDVPGGIAAAPRLKPCGSVMFTT